MRTRVTSGELMIPRDILADKPKISHMNINTDLLLALAPQSLRHRLELLLSASREDEVVALIATLSDKQKATVSLDDGFDGVADLAAHWFGLTMKLRHLASDDQRLKPSRIRCA